MRRETYVTGLTWYLTAHLIGDKGTPVVDPPGRKVIEQHHLSVEGLRG